VPQLHICDCDGLTDSFIDDSATLICAGHAWLPLSSMLVYFQMTAGSEKQSLVNFFQAV
jgi:hypothetical protein